MILDGVLLNAELSDILNELQRQLHMNDIPLLKKIKDVGDDCMITCPYHGNGQERRPSAGIRKEDGVFHCFACGETHSLQEVISYCFGNYDDILGKEGWKWLLKNFAITQVEQRNDIVIDCDRKVAKIEKQKRLNAFVSDDILDKYRYIHPYMYKRGLTDEIIELFDIGYDEETDCITFPIRDIYGNCLGVARRSTHGKYFNYPNGFEKPLYGLYEINQKTVQIAKEYYTDINTIIRKSINYYPKEVIVCESMLDALSFWTVDKYAVALNGLGSEMQFEQLRDLPCRTIILCTDMDEAGLKAREKLKKQLYNKIVMQYFLPEGRKDANDCTKNELKNLVATF